MARFGERKRSQPESSAPSKSPENQVEEIHKLVADAQEKLDQVSRALRSLGERVGSDGSAGPKA